MFTVTVNVLAIGQREVEIKNGKEVAFWRVHYLKKERAYSNGVATEVEKVSSSKSTFEPKKLGMQTYECEIYSMVDQKRPGQANTYIKFVKQL